MRLKEVAHTALPRQWQVSIPKGAIEGSWAWIIASIKLVCFNTKRCDWRLALKALGKPLKSSFNTKRCDWRMGCKVDNVSQYAVSIPKGAIEGSSLPILWLGTSGFQYQKVRLKAPARFAHFALLACFNTKRCDWRSKATWNAQRWNWFQYQKVRLKALKSLWQFTYTLSFNTKRCDWRLASICFFNEPPKFQYQKVRLKVF